MQEENDLSGGQAQSKPACGAAVAEPGGAASPWASGKGKIPGEADPKD